MAKIAVVKVLLLKHLGGKMYTTPLPSEATQLPIEPAERMQVAELPKKLVESKHVEEPMKKSEMEDDAMEVEPEIGQSKIVKIHSLGKAFSFASNRAARAAVVTALPATGATVGHVVVIGGGVLKVHLANVTDSGWEKLRPALTKLGQVQLLTAEAAEEQRKRDASVRSCKVRRAEMLSNVQGMLDVTQSLAMLHGDGGQGKKRRRLARVLDDCLDRSSRAAAFNLREVQEQQPADKDDEEQDVGEEEP